MFISFKKAFTIAEVLVATFIFSIGILSVVPVFAIQKQISRDAEKTTIASFLAQEQIENLFSLPYDEVSVGLFETRTPSASFGDFAEFERLTEIHWVDNSYTVVGSETGVKKIEIIVYWHEGSREKSETFVSLLSER